MTEGMRLALRVTLLIALVMLLPAARVVGAGSVHRLSISGNRITLDGRRGRVMYRTTADLQRDGKRETVLTVHLYDDDLAGWPWDRVMVARRARQGWWFVDDADEGSDLRTDVTDVNGDGRLEIIARSASGDGHSLCDVYTLEKGRLRELNAEDRIGVKRFVDLDHDGVFEMLSLEPGANWYLGDFWLTIYKWDGHRYVDVSRRFPKMYDRVIGNIRRMIYELQFTKAYGSKDTPATDPEDFGDLYYCLGKAYEYRGLLDKSREQYAIAYRLAPDDDWIADAYRRAFKPVGK